MEGLKAPDLLQTVRENLNYILRDINECDKIFLYVKNAQFALSQYERRAEPESKPLTLEQLRQMDGKPVWVGEKDRRSHIGHYGLVDTVRERIVFNRETYSTFRAVAGKTVYARKPEGSEKPSTVQASKRKE